MEQTIQLMETAKLMAAIGLIGRNSAKVQATIQYVAVQCIAQSIVHRNATPAKELVKNLPRSLRIDSLVAYFEKFGNLAWAEIEGAKGKYEIVFFEVGVDNDAPKLSWTNAYSNEVKEFDWTKGTKPGKIVSLYDFEEQFGTFLTTWEKRAGDSTKTIEHKDLLEKVRRDYNAYVASENGITVDAGDLSADAMHARDFNNKIAVLSNVHQVAEQAVEELLAESDFIDEEAIVIEGLEEVAA